MLFRIRSCSHRESSSRQRNTLKIAPGWFVALAALVLGVPDAAAQSPLPRLDRLEQEKEKLIRRVPPRSPQESQQALHLAPGFEAQLVAAEPLVYDPVDLCFDARGRLYVCEMRSWPLDAKKRLCRIRLLEDTDGDGRMDRATVFADQLAFPVSVCCYRGGVFVAASPDIWYMKDTDGDGRADLRRKALSGFRVIYSTHPVACLRWYFDGRIYGVARSGGTVRSLMWPKQHGVTHQVQLPMYHHFSFDPRTGDLRVESGGGQFGLGIAPWGEMFTCANNSYPLLQLVYPLRYVRRNPHVSFPRPAVPIFDPDKGMEIYRRSPVEGWRVLRQLRRVRDNLPGADEAGGRPSGTFTAASGATIYTGDQYPRFGLTALIGDTTSNLIHRKRLVRQGVLYRGKRIDRESEFLASEENWFRPVMMTNSPHGVLYVADMYREILEYIGSIPEEALRVIDLTAGRDRGRIWRIVPRGYRQPKRPVDLTRLTDAQLVALLGHPNGWHRLTAHRLLVQRNHAEAVPLLERQVRQGPPLGRMLALWVLRATGRLRPEVLLEAMQDKHPRVREHAVEVAQAFLEHEAVRRRLYRLADDSELLVRYRTAFVLGELPTPEATAALVRIALADVDQPWVRVAVLSSAPGRAGRMVAQLAQHASWVRHPKAPEFLQGLARTAGGEGRAEQIRLVIDSLEQLQRLEPTAALATARGLYAPLARRRGPAWRRFAGEGGPLRKLMQRVFDQAKRLARDASAPLAQRREALQTLAVAPWEEAAPVLRELLDPRQPPQVQVAALNVLGRFSRPEVGQWVLQRFAAFSPQVKQAALDVLLGRPERVALLLRWIEQDRLRANQLTLSHRRRLLRFARGELRSRAEKLLGATPAASRADVVARYQAALRLEGDPQRGKQVFAKHCAACHRFRGQGYALAPPLEGVLNRGPAGVLLDILDPNRQVDPEFVNYTVLLDDGRTTSGILAEETPSHITLRRGQDQQERLPRARIEAMQNTGTSLMPEGLEQQISVQQMADLLSYLFQSGS